MGTCDEEEVDEASCCAGAFTDEGRDQPKCRGPLPPSFVGWWLSGKPESNRSRSLAHEASERA